MQLREVTTPALVVDGALLDANLRTMAEALPGARLRPHVKAHKCTTLAARQAALGHLGFTCATVAEAEGMAGAGLGHDLLVANEIVDPGPLGRLARLVDDGARVTICVDSAATVEAVAAAGLREVLVDVDVGVPRCGCRPEAAGAIADLARHHGLEVRGVMGYEGHVVGLDDRAARRAGVEASMELLRRARDDVGGDVVSAGGTGTYDLNTFATEIQAGSYALMDTAYAALGLPFGQALWVWATVISAAEEWAVCDAGAKALAMDHGNPTIAGAAVWFCSDEHTTFSPPLEVGTKVVVLPAHVDTTVAYHATITVVDTVAGDPGASEVLDCWAVDLRGW